MKKKLSKMIINDKLQIPTDRGIASVDLKNIIHIEAISNYSKIYLNDTVKFTNGYVLKSKILLVAKVLKWFDENLATSGFIRIHKSHLVNKNLITDRNSNQVQLNNLEWLSISRRKKNCFLLN